jgi:drug/metabolite transporter (DMT)-like permease
VSQRHQNTTKGVLFALATTVVASTAGAASKLISHEVPVPMIVLSQYIISMLVLLPWIISQSTTELKTQHLKTHLIRGLTGWLCFFTYFSALSKVPLVDVSLLRNAAPIFVPIIAWLWVRERVPVRRWIPVFIGLAGITLVLQPGETDINFGHLWGLLSGLTLAASMVGTRILSKTDSTNVILFYYMLISLLLSIPFSIYYWQSIPLWTLPYLLFNGISVFLAMWLYTKAYSYAKPSVVSPIGYFSVILSGLLGWVIWGHVPSSTAFAGTLLIISAGALTLYIANRKQ